MIIIKVPCVELARAPWLYLSDILLLNPETLFVGENESTPKTSCGNWLTPRTFWVSSENFSTFSFQAAAVIAVLEKMAKFNHVHNIVAVIRFSREFFVFWIQRSNPFVLGTYKLPSSQNYVKVCLASTHVAAIRFLPPLHFIIWLDNLKEPLVSTS
jgi:hypothetical protein